MFFSAAHSRTAIGYTFKISPENHFINWQQDPLEIIKPVSFSDRKKELTEVEVIAKLQVINPFDYFVEEYAEEFPLHTTNASARIDCLSKFKRRKSYFPKIHGGSKTKQINTH
jgi:hypothetical protein